MHDSVMSADSVNKRMEALREGDQAITHALSELDTKLAAWVAAMEQGQGLIAHGLEQSVAAVDEEPVAVGPAESEEAVAEIAEVAEVAEAGEVVEASESVTEPEAVEDMETVESIEFEESASGMFQIPRQARATAESGEPEASAPESGADSEEDDEALLAQLDEETAKMIRVKRRLCNNQRSVRELLAEVQREEPPAEGHSQQRKQWWRLGHERQDG